MSVKNLDCPTLHKWVAALIQRGRVYAPQARGNRFAFDLLRRPEDLRLDHDVTILSPRKYLMPAEEVLVRFTRTGEFRSADESEPIILLGVHPYDVAAIGQMDRYFSQDHPDLHYLARRRNVTLIACDVQNPSEHVFAGCLGTATVREGFDLLLTLVGDHYVVESRTPAGYALLEAAGQLPDADPVSLGRREQVWADAQKLLRRQTLHPDPADLPALLERSYDHPVWAAKSKECFSCGSCTLVCPSCFCFDVQDEISWDLANGARCRHWDSCLLCDFALVAGGHNFRKERGERYRHRFYRKGKYMAERFGFLACVGCGRCVSACTADIANPVELFNTLQEAL